MPKFLSKKPKEPKEPKKPRKAKKVREPKGSKGAKKSKKKILLILIPCLLLLIAAAVAAFLFFGKSRPPKSPDAYEIGENSAPSLDLFLGEAVGTLVKIDKPTEEDPNHYVYHYDQILDSLGVVRMYYSQLILPEQGFTLVDETFLPSEEEPNWDRMTGELILVRPAVEEGQLFRLIIAYTTEQVCTVDVSCFEGAIQKPPEPEDPEKAPAPKAATLVEQVDHMFTYTPTQLGLEGRDLHEYKVFPVEGIMSVDGRACRQFNIYQLAQTEKNISAIAGTYLLTLDLQNIYMLDPATGCATLLE